MIYGFPIRLMDAMVRLRKFELPCGRGRQGDRDCDSAAKLQREIVHVDATEGSSVFHVAASD
jgi:hypothetical protein